MRVAFMSCVTILLLLSGCGNVDVGHRQQQPVPTSSKWEVVAAEPGHCDCPNGSQFFLVNKSDSPASITFTEFKNFIAEDRTESEPRSFTTVLPGSSGRKFLQCSPANTPTHNCGLEYIWNVDNVIYNQRSVLNRSAIKPKSGSKSLVVGLAAAAASENLSSAEKLPYLRLRALEGGASLVKASTSCVLTCETGSGDCLRADLGNNGIDPTGRFLQLVRNAGDPGQVPLEKMLAALGQTENPCNRSGLVISKGLVSNTGYACFYTGAEGSPFEVETRIPDTLSGFVSQPNGRLLATFPAPELFGPSLHFKDKDLDKAFGGSISKIEQAVFTSSGVKEDFVVLTGPNRCVALRAE